MSRILSCVAAAFVVAATPAAAAVSLTGALSDADAVAMFDFTLTQTAVVTLKTLSYAGGVNTAGQTIARGGFDPTLALFDKQSGGMIGQNDDGGMHVAADITNDQRFDSYLSVTLGAGSYTAALSSFANFAVGPNLADGFGRGMLFGRETSWALDIDGVDAVSGPAGVPEPATWAMLILGFGTVGAVLRRRPARVATA